MQFAIYAVKFVQVEADFIWEQKPSFHLYMQEQN